MAQVAKCCVVRQSRQILTQLTSNNHSPSVTIHFDELYINGKWIKATPIFDLKMCLENRIIPVEFDGTSDATFHPYNQDGRLHIEYIEDCGHYPDVPLDKILSAWVQAYGSERVEWYKVNFGKPRQH